MNQKITGIMPPITSPCNAKEEFDQEAFTRLATHLYGEGVHGLYPCGGTGEGYRMLLSERKKAVEISVEVSRRHSGMVLVHVGAMSSRDAANLAEHAALSGADAVASMPLQTRTFGQLKDYYSDICSASSGLPVFLYYFPMSTKIDFTLDQMLELLDIPGVAGLKYTDYNLFYMRRILLERPETTILYGCDECMGLGLLFGAHGGIGTTYNIFPKLYLSIFDAVQKGDAARAVELQKISTGFIDVAARYNGMAVLDYEMRKRGFGEYSSRRPKTILSAEQAAAYERDAAPWIERASTLDRDNI